MRKRSEVSSELDTKGPLDGMTLDQVLEEARAETAKTEPAPPPDGIQFITHSGDGPRLSDDFERIVARVFTLPDAELQYDRLEKELKLGESRNDFGTLTKSLDEAEDNARIAHKLYVNALVEKKAFEKDFAVFTASLMLTATEKLQDEKTKGTRSKQITDADVQAAAADMYPDAYRDNEVRWEKVKRMVDHMGKMSELWTQRCMTLATQLANRRK